MVHFTADEKAAAANSGQVSTGSQGEVQKGRNLLVVYPWTQRYFETFGYLGSGCAIMGNPKVKAHGKKVLILFGKAIMLMDDLKGTFLHVDPENFLLLSNVILIILATHFSKEFTLQIQAFWQEPTNAVANAVALKGH
uniref:Globin domain-containing protein n=1 Tax=Piliocolobus tephrosceles TaxID=591936 RepID=A0A8C9H2J3_9PRIM